MPSSARENYLTTEVLTAPPQKLHLMLIEAAIRSAEQGRRHWQANQPDQASEALLHAQEILGEMLAGLNPQVDAALAKKVAAVYLFIYRALMDATLHHDEKKLDDALRVLAVERSTWRQVCEKLSSTKGAAGEAASISLSAEISRPAAPSIPDLSARSRLTDLPAGGFSLEV
jgi:flagellar protein FliS